MTLQQRVGVFLLIHLLISIVYLITLTPRADLVMTWIWRFRGKQSFLLDSLRQDRVPNSSSLLVNLLIAGLGVTLLCLAGTEAFTDAEFLLNACLTAVVMIVTIGLLYQYLHLISRKYGSVFLILLFFILGVMPVFVGAALRQPQFAGFNDIGKGLLMSTPFSQALRWLNLESDKTFSDVSPYPMIVGYSIVSIFLAIMTWRWMAARVARVETTKARLLGEQPDQFEATQPLAEVVTP